MKIDLSESTDMEFKPNLNMVHKVLDQEIVGEERSRMSLFTNFVLADKFVLMAGPRSSGKTWISDHVRTYFLGDLELGTGTAYSITMGSKQSAWYQLDKINRATHIFIFEMNQMPDGFEEVLKLWGEGKDASYKVTVNQGGGFGVQNMTLKYKPTVFCLADEQEIKVNSQLKSRLTTIRTDSTIKQNKRIMSHQAGLVKMKDNPLLVDKNMLNKLREHVTTMPPFNELDFKHPAADLFVESIPPFFTDCRRDFPKYLDNTFGVARFMWKERIRIDQGSKKSLLFITPEDMFLNHIIYGQTLVESSLKCDSLQRDMIEIVKSFAKQVDRATVQRALRKIGQNVSGHMCSKSLNELADIGYLEREKKGASYLYLIGDLFNEFTFTVNWKEVIETSKKNIREYFPEIADAYIEKYCTDPEVIHPFSGKKIKLMELKEQKIDLAEPKNDLSFFVDNENKRVDKVKNIKKEQEEDEINNQYDEIETVEEESI